MTHKATLGALTAAAITVVSLSAFARTTAAAPSGTMTKVVVPVTVTHTPATRDGEEPHPRIRKAIVALQHAKYDMQHAAHDFGGHRVAALQACDAAIAQLQIALQYDK